MSFIAKSATVGSLKSLVPVKTRTGAKFGLQLWLMNRLALPY